MKESGGHRLSSERSLRRCMGGCKSGRAFTGLDLPWSFLPRQPVKFILAIMFEILVEGFHELESFLGLGQEDSGDLPEAGAGFVGAERAFEGDDGDDVMSEIECGDDGVPSVTAKSSRRLGGVEWSDSAVRKRASSDTGS